jgi:hypothetical protein
MKLNAQKELNAQDIAAELHKHFNPVPQASRKPDRAMKPPVQAPGRAGGKAFSQAPG